MGFISSSGGKPILALGGLEGAHSCSECALISAQRWAGGLLVK